MPDAPNIPAITIDRLSQLGGVGGRGFNASNVAGSGGLSSSLQQDFSAILARERPESLDPEQQARRGAEQFVAITLVQPMLKAMRESSSAAPPFAPSQGEKQFQSLMDAHLAQQIVRATHFPLVDRLARDMLSKLKVAPDLSAATDGA